MLYIYDGGLTIYKPRSSLSTKRATVLAFALWSGRCTFADISSDRSDLTSCVYPIWAIWDGISFAPHATSTPPSSMLARRYSDRWLHEERLRGPEDRVETCLSVPSVLRDVITRANDLATCLT